MWTRSKLVDFGCWNGFLDNVSMSVDNNSHWQIIGKMLTAINHCPINESYMCSVITNN